MSMIMEKATPASPLVTLPGLLQLHAGCHRGDGVRSRARRDGSGSDQEEREKPGMVLLERAGVRGYGHSGVQGQWVPHAGSCPLPGSPRGCRCVAASTTCPTKGCSVRSQDGFAAMGTFLGPFCSLYGIAQHEMLPGSRHCLETPLACNTISGRGVYNFICNRSGWSKTF